MVVARNFSEQVSRVPGRTNPAFDGTTSAPSIELPTVSVIIPALNEADNLRHVLPRIPSWLHEVVLVDGWSTDGTLDTARELWPNHHIVSRERRSRAAQFERQGERRHRKEPLLRLVSQEGKGKGAALRTGFSAATGQIIVTLDADGSMDPAELPMFVAALISGAEFVKGSRFLQGGGTSDMQFYRRWGNWGFVKLVRLLFGAHYSDLLYGYNAFWSWTVPMLQLNGTGFEIETMMNVRALKAGLKVAEVPSFEARRVHGVGRLRTIPDGWRVLKTVMNEWAFPLPESAVLRIGESKPTENMPGIVTDGRSLFPTESR